MEPMNLGSPVNSPTNNQSPQYLPAFLMGDPQPLTPHNNTLSPKPGRYNFPTSPNNNTPQDLNRSNFNTRSLFGSGNGSGSGTVNNVSGFHNTPGTPTTHHTGVGHQAGPPTQGLFDQLRKDPVASYHSPQRSQLGFSNLNTTPFNSNATVGFNNLSLNQSYQPAHTPLNDANATNASMRGLCSPLSAANVSPILGRGDTPYVRSSDYWVTIFGYPPGGGSMVLQHFTLCGNIVDVVNAPQNGNWMHVRFSSRIERDRSLSYNLKVIASHIMIGVTPCTDKSIIDKENLSFAANMDLETTKSKLRPMAKQSYKLAQGDISISSEKDIPQKSSGFVSKAMDLIFGW